MKLKTRSSHRGWAATRYTDSRRLRNPVMSMAPATLPAEHAADAAYKRVETFKFLRKLKKLPRKPMSHAVLVALGLVQ